MSDKGGKQDGPKADKPAAPQAQPQANAPVHVKGEAKAKDAAGRNMRRRVVGVVKSSKMHKTITVLWERHVKHKRYGKYVERHTKLHAHDEKNEAQVGDLVEIMATRPISKSKTWRLVRVVRKATPAVTAAVG